ncbi:MAG: M23 family metallopeptidase [Chitinophagales bacterium]|nr:M23 family metallopeptidase [Chitinophagales bacterium]
MNFLVLYVFTMLNTFATAQVDSIAYPPQDYFRAPLEIPLTLAGNFGEPRKAHFHTGLDFRTNQQEGLKVYAVADGYISRINVSGAGYGNALYIRHPNGWVSVYAHLKEFSTPIAEKLRKEQYARESFAVDFNLSEKELPVKKGEVIALSGNTGGSGGPHLHFEIRDTLDNTYNPMLFGYKLKDDLKPIVGFLKFYPLDSLKHRSDGYRIRPVLQNGVYEFTGGTIRMNAKRVGFSVNAYDVMNATEAHMGIYNLTVFDDNKMIYSAGFNKLSFPERRFVISHVDYPVFMNEGRKSYHKCFTEPGNSCGIYSDIINAGEIDLSDGKEHSVHIEITDFNGNVSQVRMKLKHDAAATTFKAKEFNYTTRFDYDHANEFGTSDFKVEIPKGCLFDDLYVSYSETPPNNAKIYSKVHQLSNSDVHLFDWFIVWVKADSLPAELKDKAVVMHKDKAGATACKGGKFENGFIAAKAREFGQFYVMADTTAPKIVPINITAGKNMRSYRKIMLKISDDLSGVADFDTYIDGKWVVTEYDAKSATLTHYISSELKSGEHIFKTVVTDERKNTAEHSIKFNW